MKKLVLLFVLGISIVVKAQNSQLFENTWYLHNFIINGNDHVPNTIGLHLQIFFYDEGGSYSIGHGNPDYQCSIPIMFENNDQFIMPGLDEIVCLTKGICYSDACINFFYTIGYDSMYMANPGSLMNYEITTEENNSLRLTVTDPEGKIAIYNTEQLTLANEDFNTIHFALFPNPAKDQLFITLESGMLKNVIIYDISGKKILEDLNANEITDVSDLTEGMYFIHVVSTEGKAVKRFVKK